MSLQSNQANGDVIDRERQFHNERFSHDTDPRAPLDKWYRAIQHGAVSQDRVVLTHARGKDVLEYGCSDGGIALDGDFGLVGACKSLTGIDISDVAIEKARAKAENRGLTNTIFRAENAEATKFADQSFDVIFGRGIIHHLDLDRSYGEVVRLLRPNGTAIFYEPMGHNPLLNMYRNKTPDLRTPDEHPLLVADFKLARKYFSRVDVSFYGLLTLGSVVLPKPLRVIGYSVLKACDSIILKLPFLNRYAWYCLMVCYK